MENEIKNLYKYHKKKYGVPAVVDNKTSTTIFLKEIKDSNTDGIDYKLIFADKGVINQGSIIYLQGKNYIALEKEEDFYSVYEKLVIRKCRDIKLVAQSKVVYGVVDSKIYDTIESQSITLADNQIVITLNDGNFIKLNDILEFNYKAYKVIAINDTREGLSILKCEYDASNTHNYTIELGATSTSIYQGDTYQINAILKDNGTAIVNPTLIYTSADDTVATVDTAGLITTIGIGNTMITIKFENIEVVFNVEVLEVIPVKPMIINGDYKLYLNNTRTYTITYDDGTAITDKTFTYSFANTSLATITASTGTSVTLKANNSNLKGYCDLVCTCVEDSSIVLVKNIWVRSLI